MRVNPNSEPTGIQGLSGRAPAPEPRLGQDQLALTTAEALNQRLTQTPDVRPEKIAEAKGLIQDVSYPPIEMIRKISALLAIHLDSTDEAN